MPDLMQVELLTADAATAVVAAMTFSEALEKFTRHGLELDGRNASFRRGVLSTARAALNAIMIRSCWTCRFWPLFGKLRTNLFRKKSVFVRGEMKDMFNTLVSPHKGGVEQRVLTGSPGVGNQFCSSWRLCGAPLRMTRR